MAAAWLYQAYRRFQGRSIPGAVTLPLLAAGLVYLQTPLVQEFEGLLRLTNAAFGFATVLGLWVLGRLLSEQQRC